MKYLFAALFLVLLPWFPSCIDERCNENRDCPNDKLCNTVSGSCYYECTEDSDCGGEGFYCENHTCHLLCDNAALDCPEGMTSICGAYCIDVYEASRPDATSGSAGTDESMATSRPGVIPWHNGVLTPAEASAACVAAGKRLCTGQEWEATCAGTDPTVYVYGNDYETTTCNGIDGWCDPECGIYQFCYMDCPHDEQIMPTGSFPGCVNEFGVYDLGGNTWEAVSATDGADHFRGGAFDCGDPGLAHKCDYDGIAAGPFPTTRGFRCCADGETP
jgi:hypothetical protein